MNTTNFPWPKKGDKAFVDIENLDQKSFRIPQYLHHESTGDNFKEAADIILDNTDSKDFHENLIYPVAYLYRHALELKLKELLRYAIYLGLTPPETKELLQQHNIAKLWAKAKHAIGEMWPNEDIAPVVAAEKVILDFHQSDKNGQMWRYPRSKDGKQHQTPSSDRYISTTHMRKAVDNCYAFVSSCTGGISEAYQNVATQGF